MTCLYYHVPTLGLYSSYRGGGKDLANPAAARPIIISKSQEQWFFEDF